MPAWGLLRLLLAGQKIRWYAFNLDLGMTWHNFHTHEQRWNFAGATVDERSLSPAESFVVETVAPPVIKLPHALEKTQEPPHRPKHAKPYKLRGDFLFHCHVEPHMMGGLAGLVRSHQTVWLTDAQRIEVEKTIGVAGVDQYVDTGRVRILRCPALDCNGC